LKLVVNVASCLAKSQETLSVPYLHQIMQMGGV
jgi:hypothetical protein